MSVFFLGPFRIILYSCLYLILLLSSISWGGGRGGC